MNPLKKTLAPLGRGGGQIHLYPQLALASKLVVTETFRDYSDPHIRSRNYERYEMRQ